MLVFVLVLVLVLGPGLGLGLGPKISGVCAENLAAILKCCGGYTKFCGSYTV